jgi:hypothetical protein
LNKKFETLFLQTSYSLLESTQAAWKPDPFSPSPAQHHPAHPAFPAIFCAGPTRRGHFSPPGSLPTFNTPSAAAFLCIKRSQAVRDASVPHIKMAPRRVRSPTLQIQKLSALIVHCCGDRHPPNASPRPDPITRHRYHAVLPRNALPRSSSHISVPNELSTSETRRRRLPPLPAQLRHCFAL